MKLTICGLFVKDMETMVTFYRDVMGLKTEWNHEPNAELSDGGLRLILFSRRDFEAMTGRQFSYPDGTNGTLELAFDAENFADVDREFARVTAQGAAPILAPVTEPWGQRTCYVSDPEGNLIEISSFIQ